MLAGAVERDAPPLPMILQSLLRCTARCRAGCAGCALGILEIRGAEDFGAGAEISVLAESPFPRLDTLEICGAAGSGALPRLVVFEDRRAGFIFSGDCASGCMLF